MLFDPDKPIRLEFTEDCDGTGTWGLVWDCPTLGRKTALVKFYWPNHGPEVPEAEIDNYYRIMGHTFAEAMDKENVTRDALRAAEAEVERMRAELNKMICAYEGQSRLDWDEPKPRKK